MEQLQATDLVDLLGEEDLFAVEPRFGAALEKANAAAQKWIDDGEVCDDGEAGDSDQDEDNISGQ